MLRSWRRDMEERVRELVPVALPHEGAMRWVKEAALSADGSEAMGRGVIGAGHAFVVEGRLQEAALVEVMAQGAAAGSLLRALREGKRVKRGLLVGVREFVVPEPVLVGAQGVVVEILARQEKAFGKLSQVYLEARVAEVVVARGRMTFHLEIE